MARTLFIIFFLGLNLNSFSQIYISTSSEIVFFSEAPLENIEAINTAAVPVLDTKTGNIQMRVPIISFKFKKALMQEHFNENYMETEKFPHATFKGLINDNDKIDYTRNGEYAVSVTGKLEIHGVTKDRTINGTVMVKDGSIIINAKFKVHIADHNIKVPTMYVRNIAEDVEVKINSTLAPYKK